MRRRITTLSALSALALVLGVGAAPALAGSPAIHFSIDPVGVVLDCGAHQYTVMSGTLSVVLHSNDDFLTGHETIRAIGVQVQVNDGAGNPTGPSYRVVGGETYGVEPAMWTGSHAVGGTAAYEVVGTGDSVHMVAHVDLSAPDGFYRVSRGTCSVPG